MATTTNRLTYDDLVALQDLPEYEHARLEIIDGELFVAATPTPYHQWAILNVAYAFESIVRSRRGVVCIAPLTVRLAPESAVEPDVLSISNGKGATSLGRKWLMARLIW
ncbi:MAG: Uma2 family endonuclease [Chloroflexia bacterium]|nr:Uma2 family endonuclease [Chloroflexia bacterium]